MPPGIAKLVLVTQLTAVVGVIVPPRLIDSPHSIQVAIQVEQHRAALFLPDRRWKRAPVLHEVVIRSRTKVSEATPRLRPLRAKMREDCTTRARDGDDELIVGPQIKLLLEFGEERHQVARSPEKWPQTEDAHHGWLGRIPVPIHVYLPA